MTPDDHDVDLEARLRAAFAAKADQITPEILDETRAEQFTRRMSTPESTSAPASTAAATPGSTHGSTPSSPRERGRHARWLRVTTSAAAVAAVICTAGYVAWQPGRTAEPGTATAGAHAEATQQQNGAAAGSEVPNGSSIVTPTGTPRATASTSPGDSAGGSKQTPGSRPGAGSNPITTPTSGLVAWATPPNFTPGVSYTGPLPVEDSDGTFWQIPMPAGMPWTPITSTTFTVPQAQVAALDAYWSRVFTSLGWAEETVTTPGGTTTWADPTGHFAVTEENDTLHHITVAYR
ncbi:hypothetical protein [Rudaeicoccus suwonensis]|uniref:Uncharacterized protein n=1 Tax=Rudaeicoccus suwonensis TaxID=657409 RepID=A0A561E717_9MICO|nr:hypothetical protein [Rudaeicoccus suwonensis]TWE11407.1 hypothetical protein BKA23_0172 [Rudaeicoccus suwonensis]